MIALNRTKKLLAHAKAVIRNERVAIGLTQKEFAEFSNIKYSTYREFEQSGKISFQAFINILQSLNKDEEFKRYLDSFEFNNGILNPRVEKGKKSPSNIEPVISPSQKQIVLDKGIFGSELFYSVDDGHKYEVSNFIGINLSHFDDKRMLLLLKYFGEKRLKPYILEKKNIKLLKLFNKHVGFTKGMI